jgi:hypothetical protein
MIEDRGNAPVVAARNGVVPVVDRDRGPAQARVVARHCREHMRADRLVGIADRDRNLNGRIEHLAPVRPRLMCVAPHVKLLRRAANGRSGSTSKNSQ